MPLDTSQEKSSGFGSCAWRRATLAKTYALHATFPTSSVSTSPYPATPTPFLPPLTPHISPTYPSHPSPQRPTTLVPTPPLPYLRTPLPTPSHTPAPNQTPLPQASRNPNAALHPPPRPYRPENHCSSTAIKCKHGAETRRICGPGTVQYRCRCGHGVGLLFPTADGGSGAERESFVACA